MTNNCNCNSWLNRPWQRSWRKPLWWCWGEDTVVPLPSAPLSPCQRSPEQRNVTKRKIENLRRWEAAEQQTFAEFLWHSRVLPPLTWGRRRLICGARRRRWHPEPLLGTRRRCFPGRGRRCVRRQAPPCQTDSRWQRYLDPGEEDKRFLFFKRRNISFPWGRKWLLDFLISSAVINAMIPPHPLWIMSII